MMLMTVLMGRSPWRRLGAALIERFLAVLLPPRPAALARARVRVRRNPRPAGVPRSHHQQGIGLGAGQQELGAPRATVGPQRGCFADRGRR
jgi:hypothetical protein